jgi:hypothetical protein
MHRDQYAAVHESYDKVDDIHEMRMIVMSSIHQVCVYVKKVKIKYGMDDVVFAFYAVTSIQDVCTRVRRVCFERSSKEKREKKSYSLFTFDAHGGRM